MTYDYTIFREVCELYPSSYECDPDKNEACTKETCIFNSSSAWPVCHRTSNEKYKWDGKTERKVKDRSGCPIDITEEN